MDSMSATMEGPTLMTPEQLAQRLNVSLKAVRRWASERRIPGLTKIGRLVRFERTTIEKALLRDEFLMEPEK